MAIGRRRAYAWKCSGANGADTAAARQFIDLLVTKKEAHDGSFRKDIPEKTRARADELCFGLKADAVVTLAKYDFRSLKDCLSIDELSDAAMLDVIYRLERLQARAKQLQNASA